MIRPSTPEANDDCTNRQPGGQPRRDLHRHAPPGAAALPGSPFPLGATVHDGGTNFAVEAAAADAMLVCLFDERGAETQIPLLDYDAGVWHGFVPGVGPGRPTGTAPRAVTIRAGLALQPGQAAARPVRPGASPGR